MGIKIFINLSKKINEVLPITTIITSLAIIEQSMLSLIFFAVS